MTGKSRLLILLILLAASQSCGLFSKSSGDAEVIFAATEVGTPQGEKVTKEIGPAGGTLVSPDGRLSLTVPQNALTETLSFSIQPITNTSGNGIGLGYRLEPNGKTFSTPLEMSVRYDERDLEGTIPELLSLAYQGPDGSWHSQAIVLDQQAKTVTTPVTHFTDWSFLAKLRIAPDKATIRIGEKLQMKLVPCYHQSNFSNRLGRFLKGLLGGVEVCELTNGTYYFDLQPNWFADVGTIDTPRKIHVIYTAPPKKPSPNIATVSIPFEFESRGDTYAPPHRGMLMSRITIVDRGYKASGWNEHVEFTGVICSLDQPFTISAPWGLGDQTMDLKFVPANGTWSYYNNYQGITAKGGGTYTLEGAGTDKPRLLVQGTGTGIITGLGQKTASYPVVSSFDLTPLETDECGGE